MANNWAIVIGINQYHFLQPLKYAKRDAEAMQDFLEREAGFDRIFLFTDDSPEIAGKPTEPFRANLLRVLRQIFAQPFMNDGDNFWFFFSGHGIRHQEQDYLMPLDGDPEDVPNTGIATHLVTSYLRSCGADNVVMILDACRNGGKKSGEGIGRQTEAEARQTGVISILSCSPDQYSYEIEAIEQGAFTYSLLEGLSIRGKCATVERLNQYLQNQVPQLVQQHLGKAKQTPYTIAEPIDRSHLIVMPQYASSADIATLRSDAWYAQMHENWDLAQRLWIRVLAAASGQDMKAIEALQFIARQRAHSIPSQSRPIEKTDITHPPNSVQTRTANSAPTVSSLPPPVSSKYKREVVGSSFPPRPASPSSTPSDHNNHEDALSSERFGANYYTKLRDLLKANKWKEADQETADRMQEVMGEDIWQMVTEGFWEFPRQDLQKINRLWVKYSGGKFGFSVQKKIWYDWGRPRYGDDWENFGSQLGWFIQDVWISYADVEFNISAPNGHLPYKCFMNISTGRSMKLGGMCVESPLSRTVL